MKSHMEVLRKALLGLVSLLAAGLVSAQPVAEQLIKEAWVAAKADLYEVGSQGNSVGLADRFSAGGGTSFTALAFQTPTLGQTRHIVAANGTTLEFFEEGDPTANSVATIDLSEEAILGLEAPGFRNITALASTDYGTLLVTGYSKRRKWFELWEIGLGTDGLTPTAFDRKAVDHPQITDAVYVPAEDIPNSAFEEGLIAAAGREILLFPKLGNFSSIETLIDIRSLSVAGLKNNTQFLSVDLVRDTSALVIATSTRELLVTPPTGANPALFGVPGISGRNCGRSRDQDFSVRTARGGSDDAVLFVSDACGQVLRLDFDDPYTELVPADPANLLFSPAVIEEGVVALAVGEGNTVVCKPDEDCPLTSGFTLPANQLGENVELFVLQYDLCDPRVAGAPCDLDDTPGDVVGNTDFALNINKILPPGDEVLIAGPAGDVTVTMSGHTYAAGEGGRFGALIVAPSGGWTQGEVEAVLENLQLGLVSDLPVDLNLGRGTEIATLLNQAQVGYSPDGNELPSVGHSPDCAAEGCYQTTYVVVDEGSAVTRMRGFSVITYGVMADLKPKLSYAAGGRVPARCLAIDEQEDCATIGGIPTSTDFDTAYDKAALPNGGSEPPRCDIAVNGNSYTAVDDYRYYFVNLAVCLFSDLETLLKSTTLIPDSAFGDILLRNELIARLENAEDKLIKGANSVGSSQGAQNLGAVFSQMASFDALVDSLTLVGEDADGNSYQIYKNELGARSEAFQFNLRHRTIPSIPNGGIVLD